MEDIKLLRRIGWYGILLTMGAVLHPGTPLRAQGARIKLAVIGLSNPSTLQKSNIGNALVDLLDSQISTVGKYTLLERAELDELRKELNLGQSDLANAKTFAQKGGLTGADFLLLGKVSEYTYHENISRNTQFVFGAGMQTVIQYDHIGQVRVDIRVVDVKTGEDVRSVSGEGTAHAAGSVSYQTEWNYYLSSEGQGTLTNLRSLLTNASNDAIQDAVNKLNDMEPDLEAYLGNRSVNSAISSIGQGTIVADLGQGQFVIGVPSTADLKVGDRFNVIAEVPLKNAQGVVVYQEKQQVGTIQVTNISESNRALAHVVGSTAASGKPGPAEGDTLLVDQAYGKTLRGMAVPASGVTAAPGAAAGGAPGPSIEAYVSRGDRFMDEQNYSEALEQYKDALQLQPSSGAVLSKKSIPEMDVGDFGDAERDADKAIEKGGTVQLAIVHLHAFGRPSEGSLQIGNRKVAFQPMSGNDGFTVGTKEQITIVARATGDTNIPYLVVNWRSEDGHTHRYNMVVPMFMTPVSSAIGIPYQADGAAADKTSRVDELIIRLINTNLP
jgi:curli biogenesis system outer membrane secretion channel CsgG